MRQIQLCKSLWPIISWLEAFCLPVSSMAEVAIFSLYNSSFLKWHEEIPGKGILCINWFGVCFRIFRNEYPSLWTWNAIETHPIINILIREICLCLAYRILFETILGGKQRSCRWHLSHFCYYIIWTVHSLFNFSCMLLKFVHYSAKRTFWSLTRGVQVITSLK